MKGPRDYQETLRSLSDERLYGMLAHEADFLPNAIAAARAELNRRGLSIEKQVEGRATPEVKLITRLVWEYRVETVRRIRARPWGKSCRVPRIFEELGGQGWELVSVNYSWFHFAYVLYFKRPRSSPPAA